MASQTNKRSGGRSERHISVRAVRRDPPDLKKLSQALIALAMAQAEAEAQQEHDAKSEGDSGDAARRSA